MLVYVILFVSNYTYIFEEIQFNNQYSLYCEYRGRKGFYTMLGHPKGYRRNLKNN